MKYLPLVEEAGVFACLNFTLPQNILQSTFLPDSGWFSQMCNAALFVIFELQTWNALKTPPDTKVCLEGSVRNKSKHLHFYVGRSASLFGTPE